MPEQPPDLNWDQLNRLTAEVIAPGGPGTTDWAADGSHTQAFNEHFIATFRANQGKLGTELDDVPLLLITARGSKSGEPRTIPLSYYTFGDRIVVVASMGGAERNPPWYYNVKANPDITVELNTGERFQARAIITEGEDREALFNGICERMPVFREYQERTSRTLPVVEIKRVE